jgi:hypothetical protein
MTEKDLAVVEVELFEFEERQEREGWAKIRRNRTVSGINMVRINGYPKSA